MATWNDVKNFLKNSHDAKEVYNGDGVSLEIEYTDGRSQMVIVQKWEVKGIEWVDIKSPIGTLSPGNINTAMEFINTTACGGIVKAGDTHAVRHCMPIADLSNDELLAPLSSVAQSADIIEEKLIGGDNL